jgi:hypothetical protein
MTCSGIKRNWLCAAATVLMPVLTAPQKTAACPLIDMPLPASHTDLSVSVCMLPWQLFQNYSVE